MIKIGTGNMQETSSHSVVSHPAQAALASPLCAVLVLDLSHSEQAEWLAGQLQLPLQYAPELLAQKSRLRTAYYRQLQQDYAAAGRSFALQFDTDGLQLLELASGVTIRVDFCQGKANHRRIYGGGAGQMIAKAVGLKGSLRPRVLDATAGLGQDSFVLASLGCAVTMLERSAIVHALLSDGLRRAQAQADGDAELAEVIARMSLISADAGDYLGHYPSEQARPQVVYLDPMFPARKKSAQVKKEMQTFHHIVGNDVDAGELLAPALALALARVVVKRPKIAPYLADCEPDHQLIGKSSRYDIYINQALDKC